MSRPTKAVLTLSVAAFAMLAPGAAHAATDTTSITITGGTLDYTTPFTAGDFPATTLSGLQQIKTASVDPFAVTDSRGGAAGWHLTIAASRFTSGSDQLPLGSMSLATPPVPTTTIGNLGIAPIPNVALGASPIDDGSSHALVDAAAVPLGGAGKWTFTPVAGTLTLTIPPAVVPGTYSSTITTTLSTGP